MTEIKKESLWVKKPAQRNGQWVVVVADSPSPLAKEIEVIQCGSHESAYQSYKKIMKELGRSY